MEEEMKNKWVWIGVIIIVIGLIVGISIDTTSELHEDENSKSDKNSDRNAVDLNNENEDSAVDHEMTIFFIENPQYEDLYDSVLHYIIGEFPSYENEWENFAFTVITYIYGMINKSEENVVDAFAPEKNDEKYKLIEDHMSVYDDIDIQHVELLHTSKEEFVIIYLLNDIHREDYDKNRLLLFDLNKGKIILDRSLAPIRSDQLLNDYFDLPPIEDILEQDQYAHLHETIKNDAVTVGLEKEMGEKVANGIIYYFHGVFTEDAELITSFSLFNHEDYRSEIVERDVAFYKPLKTYDIELANVKIGDIKVGDFDVEYIFEFQFTRAGEMKTSEIAVEIFYMLDITTIYDVNKIN